MARPDPQLQTLADRWLARYGRSDAYPRWLVADPQNAPNRAFTAIAVDDRLLMRINRGRAAAMVQQAEQMLRQFVANRVKSDDPKWAAARVVKDRIESWRQYDSAMRQRARKDDPLRATADLAAARVLDPAQNLWDEAERDYPQFKEWVGK